jgi:uncharacterized protein YciI
MSDKQQFLYRVQPTRPEMLSEGPTPAEERIVSDHFAYLQNLAEQGTVMLAGRTLNTDPSSFGIIIFLAESEAAAQSILQNDPAVQQGVMNADLFPYRIAILKNTSEI